jgi:hypothetical protein
MSSLSNRMLCVQNYFLVLMIGLNAKSFSLVELLKSKARVI